MTSDQLQKAEEILLRYIQERKKPLAELALETLTELAPDHPRRQEYALWVAELDQELALEKRIAEQLAEGRKALRGGELGTVRRHLDALRKLDPDADATVALAREIEAVQQSQVLSADIGRLKKALEDQLATGQIDVAEATLGRLAQQAVPKLTIDFFRRRIGEARAQARDQADARDLESAFATRVAEKDWQGARDVAHRFGERFPDRPDGAQMFNRVGQLEATDRRQLSIQQGIATVEQMLENGDRAQAELALKLLRGLSPDPERLSALEARVAAL